MHVCYFCDAEDDGNVQDEEDEATSPGRKMCTFSQWKVKFMRPYMHSCTKAHMKLILLTNKPPNNNVQYHFVLLQWRRLTNCCRK